MAETEAHNSMVVIEQPRSCAGLLHAVSIGAHPLEHPLIDGLPRWGRKQFEVWNPPGFIDEATGEGARPVRTRDAAACLNLEPHQLLRIAAKLGVAGRLDPLDPRCRLWSVEDLHAVARATPLDGWPAGESDDA